MQGTARVEAERVAVAKIALGRGTGEATLQGRRLDASLKFPERQLEMSARGDLAPGQVLAARLALRSFDLASLHRSGAPGEPPHASAARSRPAPTPPSRRRTPDLRGAWPSIR